MTPTTMERNVTVRRRDEVCCSNTHSATLTQQGGREHPTTLEIRDTQQDKPYITKQRTNLTSIHSPIHSSIHPFIHPSHSPFNPSTTYPLYHTSPHSTAPTPLPTHNPSHSDHHRRFSPHRPHRSQDGAVSALDLSPSVQRGSTRRGGQNG